MSPGLGTPAAQEECRVARGQTESRLQSCPGQSRGERKLRLGVRSSSGDVGRTPKAGHTGPHDPCGFPALSNQGSVAPS